MTRHTHNTAPTQYVVAGETRYAYRRFGSDTGTPLIFLQHFRGGMDHWDPLVTDGLGRDRPIILFDNAGIGASGGYAPDTMEAMGEHVAAFLGAIGVGKVDVLGFSVGGFVAQAFVIEHPALVRRLMLLGTGPRGGVPGKDHRVGPAATRDVPVLEDILVLFFSPSVRSRAAGREFWERRHQRVDGRDAPSSQASMVAQLKALEDWGKLKGERYADLRKISQPTLVINGSNDIMVPTINSYDLSQAIPNSQLIIYPDAGHGSQYQYPNLFLAHARAFLDATEPETGTTFAENEASATFGDDHSSEWPPRS